MVETRFSRSLCAVESVFLAVAGGAGAFHHKVEEFRVICLADDEGVRLSRFSRAKRRELVGKSIEDGMILNLDVDFHPPGPFFKVLDGVDELLHLTGATLSDESSADHSGDVRLAVILHRNDQAERAGRMSGNEDGSYALVAKSDGHALEGVHVFFRELYRRRGISSRSGRARNVYEVPIGRSHINVSAVMLLKIRGAAEMVLVAMR